MKKDCIISAVIEIQKGSNLKYEFDNKTRKLRLDRILKKGFRYPGDYGFIPKTLDDDGDPLDIIILSRNSVKPMTKVKAKVIGLIKMLDDSLEDDKIIAAYDSEKTINKIPKQDINNLKKFFANYKGKKCRIISILGKEDAYKEIEYCK